MQDETRASVNQAPRIVLDLIPLGFFLLGLAATHDSNIPPPYNEYDDKVSYFKSQDFKYHEGYVGNALTAIGEVGIVINGVKNFHELRGSRTSSIHKP